MTTPENPVFPWPRKKHSHRCPICRNAVYCYRTGCQKPQRTECDNCRWQATRRAQAAERGQS